MTIDTNKFHAHQALPEDLAHKIFEAIRAHMPSCVTPAGAHDLADHASKEVQQAVADAFADLTFKLIARRDSRAPSMPSVK